MHVGALQLENRIPAEVAEALGRLGHRIGIVGPFMMDTGTVVAGFDGRHATVFGAADVRRQRFVAGW
jgi:gamma-glutamyltranspeptidase/glutathione hydrolase